MAEFVLLVRIYVRSRDNVIITHHEPASGCHATARAIPRRPRSALPESSLVWLLT